MKNNNGITLSVTYLGYINHTVHRFKHAVNTHWHQSKYIGVIVRPVDGGPFQKHLI